VSDKVIAKINANGVKIIKQKGIDTTLVTYGDAWKDISKAPRDIESWIA
jgi:hypothetical protein